MCGLIGGITRKPVGPERIGAALDVLDHRGPDGQGRWTSDDGCTFLGHTRLSIIGLDNGDAADVERAGRCPHRRQRRVLRLPRHPRRPARQGRQFATDSDSEIALHLYLQHGMRAGDTCAASSPR